MLLSRNSETILNNAAGVAHVRRDPAINRDNLCSSTEAGFTSTLYGRSPERGNGLSGPFERIQGSFAGGGRVADHDGSAGAEREGTTRG